MLHRIKYNNITTLNDYSIGTDYTVILILYANNPYFEVLKSKISK